MKLLRSLIGRRQFLIGITSSTIVLSFKRLARVFDLFFKGNSAAASGPSDDAPKKQLRACVAYYSATGSTGKISEAIYRGMKSVMPCDVAPISKLDPNEMGTYDVVAVGGPIWYYRETANLRIFINEMPDMTGKLCAAYCTHGVQPNGYFYSLAQPLQKKAFTIIGWNDWYGDATHVLHMPDPYHTHGHPDEIDLKEAETFGREMAERARRIFAGERNLIPDIPTGPDADPLWVDNNRFDYAVHENYETSEAAAFEPVDPGGSGDDRARTEGGGPGGGTEGGMPSGGGEGGMSGGGGGGPFGMPESTPVIDMDRCVYPRCRACMDNCVVGAISIPLAAPAGKVSTAPVLVTEACIHCSHPLCERSCSYDAIAYTQLRTIHVIHMEKCTYPKCTLCIDECPMKSIDFSQNPPVFHNNCEGCDLCWCICPVDAIEITNIAETHARLGGGGNDSFFFRNLAKAEASGRFRRLTPLEEVGWDNIVYKKTKAPRVVLKPENYPYHMGE